MFVPPKVSFFVFLFLFVLGFPLCVVFFVFFCSSFPAIPLGSLEGQGRQGWAHNGQNSVRGDNRTSLNMPVDLLHKVKIFFKTRRMKDCQSQQLQKIPALAQHILHGWERHRQPQAWKCRAGTRRNCEQQCMRGDIATGGATLPERCAATGEGLTCFRPCK